MKPLFSSVALASVMLLFSCGNSRHDETHDQGTSQSTDETQALYNEVMRLHDEGMERMDEMQRLKRELTEKIESAPELVEEKSHDLEQKIVRLDSASKGMMVWMRQFHPENDTLDDAAYHHYLESQLHKVKKVRENIFEALERAKEE